MRADKDFRTYEQALTIVQRYGELAEAEYAKGKSVEAGYHLAHATFVGVKHLLFMAADAAVDRAEARELAASNHLAMVELLSVALISLDRSGDDLEAPAPNKPAARIQRRSAQSAGIRAKAKKTASDPVAAKRSAPKRTTGSVNQRNKAGLRVLRPR